jgi:uncharacterized OsmC-like protein
MKFETICNLIIAICGVIPTIVSLVVLIVNIIKNKNWTLIVTMIKEAMTTVETYAKEHPEMTSDDKLNMALESVKSACSAAGIKLDTELIKKIISYINEMCSWSKTVNNNSAIEETKAIESK